ncbi:hypothetical protein AKJ48_01585 [candidate division MSBL1 archaeon SCGC-AAA261O19]|uniref:DNA methylase N-4/N-6 domain-containing protein n=1 Tax=candidate division MSBL1 archaeon SCGC-AAA261O19 TaxID=1698277 RepID=A0A133VE78_9EURY|nr:hypothetical protein AKJ48_01585 [candidate division MSBL1 archaeon SCGC-AAA261O19]
MVREPSSEIDKAFVAELHPPLYSMHMYWARKPHNVVAEYIRNYSHKGGIVLDPFCGSGVAPIEAIKHDRKAIGIDLNPMAIFISRMTAKPVNIDEYISAFERIQNVVRDKILELYETECPSCGETRHINQTVWEGKEPAKIKYECKKCAEGRKKYVKKDPDRKDLEKIEEIEKRKVPCWYPKNELYYPNGKEFREGTHQEGKNSISDLFTKRNLIALSILYDEIGNLPNGEVKELMKFTFTGSLHLGSKMLPARKSRGGPVWSQHRFWLPKDFWERNVWNNFETRFQRVLKGKKECNEEISYYKEAKNIDDFLDGDANILWINEDALDALREIDRNIVDFVFTDPTYGESIQYGELCYMWASWLGYGEDYLNKMKMDEVVINEKQNKDLDEYYNMLYTIFEEVSRVARHNSRMTVTFHNPSFEIRNTLEKSCYVGGYDLENVIWQPPASVPSSKSHLQPYGSVQGDFYFRFRNIGIYNRERLEDEEAFKRIVAEAAKEIVAERGEPTPMNIVTNGIEPALAEHGFPYSPSISVTEAILEADAFVILNKNGDEVNRKRTKKLEDKTLWLRNPEKYLLDRVPLNERIEKTVHGLLLRKRKIDFTGVMRELYTTFQNALTPNPPSVKSVLSEYGEKERGLWKVKFITKKEATQHSRMVGKVAEVGKNLGYKIWIGIREQSDNYQGLPLSEKCDFESLTLPRIQERNMERIRNIDVLWIDNQKIESAFEVENTTGITGAIVRGSNIPYKVDKFILIPENREDLLAKRLEAPMIKMRLEKYDWKFIFFEDFEKEYNRTDGEIELTELDNISIMPSEKKEEKQTFLESY